MPLTITKKDFDTVCYNLQHNVMQLVNGVLSITISFNGLESSVDDMKAELDTARDQMQDVVDVVGDVIDAQKDLASVVNGIITLIQEQNDQIESLWDTVTDLTKRVQKLEKLHPGEL